MASCLDSVPNRSRQQCLISFFLPPTALVRLIDRSIETFANATAPAFTASNHGVQRTDGATSRFTSHFQC